MTLIDASRLVRSDLRRLGSNLVAEVDRDRTRAIQPTPTAAGVPAGRCVPPDRSTPQRGAVS